MQHRRISFGARLAVSAALAVTLMSAPATLGAQAPAARDTLPHRLAPVVTTASREGVLARIWRGIGARAELGALQRENRALERQLRSYDRTMARLEAHLARIRARPDSLRRDIALLDSATAATRAERARLEQRVRALEAERGIASTDR